EEGPPASGDDALPVLPKPGEAGARKSSSQLHKLAVPSVVLVEAKPATGSGVCVGRGDIVLTNDHVIAKAEGDVFVYPFTYKGKEMVRLPRVRARALYRSAAQDIAVLKLDKALLKPLPVALESPSPGDKVYAIGSP